MIRKIANSGTSTTTTDYIDGFVYVNSALSYFPTPEGRMVNNSGNLTPEYIITDQQGNARVSINQTGAGNTAKVIQENSYYGFGMTMPGTSVSLPTVPNKQLYNGGSELQNDFANLPDLQQTFYRNYDAALGRWTGADPQAEGAESMSGYQYSGNNPIMYNDVLGNKANASQNQYYDPNAAANAFAAEGNALAQAYTNAWNLYTSGWYDQGGNGQTYGTIGTITDGYIFGGTKRPANTTSITDGGFHTTDGAITHAIYDVLTGKSDDLTLDLQQSGFWSLHYNNAYTDESGNATVGGAGITEVGGTGSSINGNASTVNNEVSGPGPKEQGGLAEYVKFYFESLDKINGTALLLNFPKVAKVATKMGAEKTPAINAVLNYYNYKKGNIDKDEYYLKQLGVGMSYGIGSKIGEAGTTHVLKISKSTKPLSFGEGLG